MSRETRRVWRSFLPDRRAWPYLLTSPTSYLLVVALVLTMAGKMPIIRGFRDIEHWFSHWLLACSRDVAFFLGLAAVLALGERVRGWVSLVTVPIAMLVTAVAIINIGYMSISGEQLSWQILTLGLERFGDVSGIARATLLAKPLRLVVGLIALGMPPFAAVYLMRLSAWPRERIHASLARAKAAGVCALFSLLVALVFPRPHQYALARMYGNGVMRTYWGMATGAGDWNNASGFFAGYEPHDLVDSSTIEKLKTGARPNVIVVVLESTRRDETSLPGGRGRARTPNLEALAAHGADITEAHAVITQTTKSVWSVLCGRLPLLQTTIYETSSSIEVQCLPHILNAAGYRTAFFQSAMGIFEDRPRLVHGLGFQSFKASEHITGDIIGYLASDDETLVEPIARWLDEGKGAPFMLTVLTSSTHHPYALSEKRTAALKAAGAAITTDRDRYDRGIEISDALIGGIRAALDQRGLTEKTIIVVVGDHGEGFGDTGARQHGSNFYEEGLHVPFIMAGPGVPHTVIDRPVSLMDVTPTLLGLLDAQLTPAAARSTPALGVFGPAPTDRLVPFSCYYDNACRGFIVGRTKVVRIPETGQTFSFDLDHDRDERDPHPLTPPQRAMLTSVDKLIEAHRAAKWLLNKAAFDTYPDWKCEAARPCTPINPLKR